jgi:hypothetical protein
MGGWAVAPSPILGTTITIKRLKMKGYVSLSEYYKSLSIIIEPPYTRPAWPVLTKEGSGGGAYAEASAQACERRTPSVSSGGVVYSIITIIRFSTPPFQQSYFRVF